MSLNDRLIAHEGIRYEPYRDSKGYWTVGVGHLISTNTAMTLKEAAVLVGAPWDREKCLAVLEQDKAHCVEQLSRSLPWFTGLAQNHQDVLVELAFNLGFGGLLGFHKMLGCFEKGDWEGAVQQLLYRNPPDPTPSQWATEVGAGRTQDIVNLIIES